MMQSHLDTSRSHLPVWEKKASLMNIIELEYTELHDRYLSFG
jgi:hypothetical protein